MMQTKLISVAQVSQNIICILQNINVGIYDALVQTPICLKKKRIASEDAGQQLCLNIHAVNKRKKKDHSSFYKGILQPTLFKNIFLVFETANP